MADGLANFIIHRFAVERWQNIAGSTWKVTAENIGTLVAFDASTIHIDDYYYFTGHKNYYVHLVGDPQNKQTVTSLHQLPMYNGNTLCTDRSFNRCRRFGRLQIHLDWNSTKLDTTQ